MAGWPVGEIADLDVGPSIWRQLDLQRRPEIDFLAPHPGMGVKGQGLDDLATDLAVVDVCAQ